MTQTRNNSNGNETMAAKQITIMLSEIAGEAESNVDGAGSLSDTDAGQIVERFGGRLLIIDGFHRTAGQAAYCQENGIDTASHEITVVLACEDDSDNQLVADASEPGAKQDAAIAAIYRQAGR